MNLGLVILAAVAGGAGAAMRVVVDAVVPRPHGFPLGILVVNLTGSLLLGLLTPVVSADVLTVVGVGVLGGFTTFSAVSVETALLAQRRRWAQAGLNLFGTAALAVGAAGIGLAVGVALAGAAS
ncbi:MAG TPA: CrcB family protein [Agromyces sp.]